MFSLESSPSSSPESSPWSSPGSNQASPGLSDALGGLMVREQDPDMPARRRLFIGEQEADLEPQRPVSPEEMLQETKKKIRRIAHDSPLLPRKGSTAVGVYPITSPTKTNPHAVFKPGKMNTVKAMLCSEVAKILDLDPCVPTTIKARAAFIISQEDLDESSKPIVYKKAYMEGAPWVVNPEMAYRIVSMNRNCVCLGGGCDFTLQCEDGVYTLEPKTKKAEEHELAYEEVVILSIDGKNHVVQADAAHPVTCGIASSYVERGNARFELKKSQDADDIFEDDDDDNDAFETEARSSSFTESKDGEEIPDNVHLMRRNVEGFLQPMIQNVVTEIDGKRLNIIAPSERREKFFSMIDTCSFINSVVLAVLFRTQDGKAGCLDDTNFLFTQEKEKLHLTLIDLDETWPTGNGLTEDPELREKGEIAALRLGLMAYPQAHKVLDADGAAHLGALLRKIGENEETLVQVLGKYKLPQIKKVTIAFKDVIKSLNKFYVEKQNSPVTLAELVFHVFPVYKAQWDELKTHGVPIEKIAEFIGFASVKEVKAMGKGAF